MQFKKINQGIRTFVASNRFFYAIVGIFLLSSVWLVFTSRYPMAFDENYHYEIIQTYAKQWNPFFSAPPAGTEQLGDITRYPSYLFHYIFSFPYRLLSIFTDSNPVKIIALRLINVAMLASSFWLFKRLFDRLRLSRVIGNMSLFIFALIPIVPFLGAQISYDNATIPLTALTLLTATSILTALRKGDINLQALLGFLSLGLFASLIKYTYLPIFVTVFLYLLISMLWAVHAKGLQIKPIIKKKFTQFSLVKKILLCGVLLLGVTLCIERYGINVIRYKNPVPDCNQILSEQSCRQYGPWGRDYELKMLRKTPDPQWRIADYNKIWWRTTLYEFYFAINHLYEHKEPLTFLYGFARYTLYAGMVATVIFAWRIIRNPTLRLFAITSSTYALVIWLDNYMKFTHVHWPVAIHGRYLLPLVPLMAVVMGYSLKYLIETIPNTVRKPLQAALLTLIIGGLLYGGGVLTYIARSEPSWYWQQDMVITVNTRLNSILTMFLR